MFLGEQQKISSHRTSNTDANTTINSMPSLDGEESFHNEDVVDEDASSESGYDDLGDSSVDNMQAKAAKETRKNLGKSENKTVKRLRYLVILVLLTTATGVSVATYFYSRGVENSTFNSEFASVALVTLRSFVEAFEHKLSSMDAVTTGITSHASRTGEVFPNVTVPDFEIKGSTARTQTDSIFMFWLPLVTDEDRKGYEAYTAMQQQHLFASYMTEEGLRQYQDAIFGVNASETKAAELRAEEAAKAAEAAVNTQQEGDQIRRILHAAGPDIHPVMHETIWGLGGERGGDWPEPEGTGPFLPTWQLSPTIPLPALLNFNFLAYTDLAPMFRQCLKSAKATLSYLQTSHQGGDTEDLIRTFLSLNQYRHTVVNYNADPMTQVSYPVFDSFHPTEKKVVGVTLTAIFWRLLFVDILREDIVGVICVLSNSLGDEATYRIDGGEASYVGPGDLHDPQFDDMVVTRKIDEYMKTRASPLTTSYTFIDLDTEYTSYEIHVYPSEDMKASYTTSQPIYFAFGVVLIFIFTSLVFFVYDWNVERRQKLVLDTAVKSNAVVQSLFPTAVHDRLFGEKEESEKGKKNQWKVGEGGGMGSFNPRGSGKSIIDQLQNGDAGSTHGANPDRKRGRPIADKFANCSVYFADMAGFTKWSSTREPIEVFELLEALYGAFDRVATRRNVFKVETIGDCYMAATGLPNPQPDHAIRMVKFARDCMAKMNRTLEDLAGSLGEDTLELGMRIGIHSGPVTAGVLRGDKGRFQLFGDTVNTASRMESNGVKGRIHVSDSTAALLPSKWLTMREDKIVAKGKGEMTTFFVATVGTAGSLIEDNTYHSRTELGDNEEPPGLNPMNTTSSNGTGTTTSNGSEVQFQRSFSFSNEPENELETAPKRASNIRKVPMDSRPMSPSKFGMSIAQAMGIDDELEV